MDITDYVILDEPYPCTSAPYEIIEEGVVIGDEYFVRGVDYEMRDIKEADL